MFDEVNTNCGLFVYRKTWLSRICVFQYVRAIYRRNCHMYTAFPAGRCFGDCFTLLSHINCPSDIRDLTYPQLLTLAREVRKKIIETVGANGGHLSSNLGVVELTIALHRVFESPRDAIVWDVGHQCYTHKLLTGRYDRFDTLRRKGGVSGFPKRSESVHDMFDTGHSSTSISAALGILTARSILHQDGKVVAVIGDGALSGGMAMEALSHAGHISKDLIVVLNDNRMSINENTGSLSRYLSRLSMTPSYQSFRSLFDKMIARVPVLNRRLTDFVFRFKRGIKGLFYNDNLFVDLGFEYVGPLNGHNIKELESVFRKIKKLHRPVVVHVVTQKGRGYSLAENDPAAFHGIGPFCISDGTVEKFDNPGFTAAFSRSLVSLAGKDERIVAVTAAMAKGTGLGAFQRRFPGRFFDVDIAEQHAVTFAGGLAVAGLKPVVAIYSTFMQRAVDQVITDVALQNASVVFALDRSGAVPDDGETHQGIYDIALFRPVPNVTLLAPASAAELGLCLEWAVAQNSPVMLRYPKAVCPSECDEFTVPLERGRGVLIPCRYAENARLLFVCTGGLFSEALAASRLLWEKERPADIYNLRFIKPIDTDFFIQTVSRYDAVVCAEDGVLNGGISRYLQALINVHCPGVRTAAAGFGDAFFSQGKRCEILESAGLSSACLAARMEELL